MIVSPILLCFSSSGAVSEEEATIHPIVPIVVILIGIALVSTRSIMIKYSTNHYHTNPFNVIMFIMFIDGLLITPAAFATYATVYKHISTEDILIGLACGISNGIGLIGTNVAISLGKGGPASAFNNLIGVFQTVLAALVLGQIPDLIQYISLALCLVGVFIITFSHGIMARINRKSEAAEIEKQAKHLKE